MFKNILSLFFVFSLSFSSLSFASGLTKPPASTLDDLTDVETTGVNDGDVIRYDNASGTWKDAPIPITAEADTLATVMSRGSEWDTGNVSYIPLTGNIETAINNATSGDTLILATGTYVLSDDIDITKSINIIGQGIGKTVLSCTVIDKRPIHITSDFVHIRDLSLRYATSGDTFAIALVIDASATTVFTDIRLENLDITVTTANGAYAAGLTSNDAGGILRNVTVHTTPGISTGDLLQYAVYIINGATAEAATTWTIDDCHFSIIANTAFGYPASLYLNDNVKGLTVNLYNSSFDCSNANVAGGSLGLFSSGQHLVVNAYNSVFNGYNVAYAGAGNADIYQQLSSVINSYQNIIKSNQVTGTVVNRYNAMNLGAATLVTTGQVKFPRSLTLPVANPTASDNLLAYRTPVALTLSAVNAIVTGGTSVDLKLNECDANGINCVPITDTITATTSNTAGTITNGTIDAGDWISYTSSAKTGTVPQVLISMEYTE